ncbi:MAG: signal transduction histidine kinase [Planctomycetota bacterium]|jgi:signal transduction histidine kinase
MKFPLTSMLRKLPMRKKILLILSFVVGGYAAADHVIQRLTVLEVFYGIERDFAQADTVRVKEEIEQELQALDGRAIDWVHADGIAEFMEGENSNFVEKRLSSGVLDRQGLDVLYLCDMKGTVLWGRYLHPDSGQSSESSTFTELPGAGEKIADRLLTGWRIEDVARGIVREQKGFLDSEFGPLLVSTRIVAKSSGGRGSSGIVVMGRFLSDGMISSLEMQTKTVGLQAQFFDEAQASQTERQYVGSFDGEPLIRVRDDDWLEVNHLLPARVEDGMLMLRADVARKIASAGEMALSFALNSTVIAGLVMILVLLGLLQKAVLSPISKLMKNAVRIGEDDLANVKFDLDREDEIGILAREFDNMMEKVAAARGALVDTARQAGKAEIASGILHNVGNVLNSVNVSSSMLTKKAEALAVGDLETLNGIISEHAEDLGKFIEEDPRGKHFPPFLNALTEQFSAGKIGIQEEINSLSQGIDRIRDLVNSQQEYVSRAEVIESVDLSVVLDKALSVSENVDAFHRGFEVEREYADLPNLPIDRYKTLEVLVNLIQNARQSIEEHGGDVRRLTVRLLAPNDERVRIEIADTGLGIEAQNLAKVFDHGFTTKVNGHGFGLHSAANAATEMSGSLTAASDGVGKGATFVLELPTRVAQESRGI